MGGVDRAAEKRRSWVVAIHSISAYALDSSVGTATVDFRFRGAVVAKTFLRTRMQIEI